VARIAANVGRAFILRCSMTDYIDFEIHDGELYWKGVARYSLTAGCPGDYWEPGEPAGVDWSKVIAVHEVGREIAGTVVWWEVPDASQARVCRRFNDSEYLMRLVDVAIMEEALQGA